MAIARGTLEGRSGSDPRSMLPSLILRLATAPAPMRLLAFLLTLVLLWVPFALPISWLVSDRNLVSIITMVILYAEFLWLLGRWNRWGYHRSSALQHYGLVLHRQMAWEWLLGLSIGLVSLLLLFAVEGWLGWAIWKPGVMPLPRVVVEGVAIALGVGFAEEVFFRGWLLDELERDYSPQGALWSSSLLFALLHFIKPLPEVWRTLPQFAGLLLLGLLLVWAKRQTRPASSSSLSPGGRLGLPIGVHGGLVWGYYIINVGGFIDYSGRVPAWVTGVDRNPLAGLMGLVFLSAIALLIRSPWFKARLVAGLK